MHGASRQRKQSFAVAMACMALLGDARRRCRRRSSLSGPARRPGGAASARFVVEVEVVEVVVVSSPFGC